VILAIIGVKDVIIKKMKMIMTADIMKNADARKRTSVRKKMNV
jgi:hypothetical protein